MKDRNIPEPEFSRPLPVDKIASGGIEQKLEASAEEREHLSKRFGLSELPKLRAELSVSHARAGRMIAVEGVWQADVVQQCVVTLEPLPSHIEDKINVLFVEPELLEGGSGPPTIEPDGEEVPEPIMDGIIDLGELVAQHLGVALDPYPRKPDVAYIEATYGEEAVAANPFAKLADLGKKPKH